jgi:hypothetical protein
MSKSLTFIIDADGNVRIDKVEGYGAGCLEATKLLERRLGAADLASRKYTEEIYDTSISGEIEGGIEL